MLVLSRRVNEKLIFPGLSATVHVLGIKSGTVRLGIDAPRDITVLRDEVAVQRLATTTGPTAASSWNEERKAPSSAADDLRVASMKLGMARLKLSAGRTGEAEAELRSLHSTLQLMLARAGACDRRPASPSTQRRDTMPRTPARRKTLEACAS